MDDPIGATLPFLYGAVSVAEGLSPFSRTAIQAACKRDIVRRFHERFTSFKPDYRIHYCGRVVAKGWVAHYVWRSDQEGGIYVLASPSDEDDELAQSQFPPKEGDRAHLELNLLRLDEHYWSLDCGGQNAMVRRAVRSSTGANYVADRNLIAEAEDRLGMYGCLYRLENDYEASWLGSLSDTWFPEGILLTAFGGDEGEIRGAMVVQYGYAREHPFMRKCRQEYYGRTSSRISSGDGED